MVAETRLVPFSYFWTCWKVMPVNELLQSGAVVATADAKEQGAQLLAAFAKIESPHLRAAVLTLVSGLTLR
jgi:hypothetical protein